MQFKEKKNKKNTMIPHPSLPLDHIQCALVVSVLFFKLPKLVCKVDIKL